MSIVTQDDQQQPTVDNRPADDHAPFLADHFGSAQQQFDAGKLGMWLFLISEVLFFSGLFCAYAVYRSMHPEAFASADKYLDVTLGATNTAVLIFSSLTMAWAVRAAQLGQQKLLIRLLTITLACASMFLGIKAIEYSHKWDTGVLWSRYFAPQHHAEHGGSLIYLCAVPAIAFAVIMIGIFAAWRKRSRPMVIFLGCLAVAASTFFVGVGLGQGIPWVKAQVIASTSHAQTDESNEHLQLASDVATYAPVELLDRVENDSVVALRGELPPEIASEQDLTYTGIFFSIYYVMTGLHAIHIIAGMGAISWLLWRASKQHFSPAYFGPVDYVGLYWHLVDLIWIYLFPLLYLIG